nr:hypothetical protein [Candidatus Sigynarchaeota archaeon]
MYIVEIGLLYREQPLVHVGFYRKNEELNDVTKEKIILGIYSIVPEIFKDHVLKRLNVAKYTILFFGFELAEMDGKTGPEAAKTPANLVLSYAIVDLESGKLDNTSLRTVQAKMQQLGKEFSKQYGDKPGNLESADFNPFKAHILSAFKDMLKKPEDRFDTIWEKRGS